MQDIKEQLLNGFARVLSETEEPEQAQNPLDSCISIPRAVYELLPKFHRTLCELNDAQPEKDAFLCGLLPTVASALINVEGAHADGRYTPDFFVALVAGAGEGKGAAARAFRIVQHIESTLRADSQREREFFETAQAAREKGAPDLPEPAEKCLVVPANVSAAALIQALYDNDGRALIIETEIDALLAADRNAEWGNTSAILRAAFHHETVSARRKSPYRGQTTLSIKRPYLSVFLSGTPNQFRELMKSTENGLFSRFAAYFHNPPMKWRSHRPTANSTRRDTVIESEARILETIWQYLRRRKSDYPAVMIELTEQQWDKIDDTFSKMQDEFFHTDGRADLLPTARRGAIIAFRLAMQFAVFRWLEQQSGAALSAFGALCSYESAVIQATDADVDCGILLAYIFTQHAQSLSSLLPQTISATSSKASVMRFFEALPTEFTTADALVVANERGIPERTAKRYLSNMVKSKILDKAVNGRYEKRQVA